MSEYLANARAYCQDVDQTSDRGIRISWLTVICKQIISHLELSESAKPVTDHLIAARKAVSSASLAPDAGCAITWLTETCEQILNHLEVPQDSDRLPQWEIDLLSKGENNEQSAPVWDPRLQKLLDQAQIGDLLTITNRNGKHLANVSGPVLVDQTHDQRVGIDLLDGEPYYVRDEAGIVWAPIAYATLCRDGELVAMWVEDAHH